jgi:transcriptional regulator with XRE-family HTH domain
VHDDTDRRRTLAFRVGELLQSERARSRLTQRQLAIRAGTTQQWVSRVERGTTAPTTTALDRLFGALDLQLRVDPEPVGTDFDVEIDKYAAMTAEDRLASFQWYRRRFDQLGDLPYVVSGRLAAFVQGAPIAVPRIDLAVAEKDLGGYAELFARVVCSRWNERWLDYGGVDPDPREPGSMRWKLGYDEVRLHVSGALPPAIVVQMDNRRLPVRPLLDVERDFRDVALLMRRVRARGFGPVPG